MAKKLTIKKIQEMADKAFSAEDSDSMYVLMQILLGYHIQLVNDVTIANDFLEEIEGDMDDDVKEALQAISGILLQ